MRRDFSFQPYTIKSIVRDNDIIQYRWSILHNSCNWNLLHATFFKMGGK